MTNAEQTQPTNAKMGLRGDRRASKSSAILSKDSARKPTALRPRFPLSDVLPRHRRRGPGPPAAPQAALAIFGRVGADLATVRDTLGHRRSRRPAGLPTPSTRSIAEAARRAPPAIVAELSSPRAALAALFSRACPSLGHALGDLVLIETARRLERCLRGGDILARLGGDEFLILLDSIEDAGVACEVAKRVLRALDAPFALAERRCPRARVSGSPRAETIRTSRKTSCAQPTSRCTTRRASASNATRYSRRNCWETPYDAVSSNARRKAKRGPDRIRGARSLAPCWARASQS